MAEESAGRVLLCPCFQQWLWTAYTEITGGGGTPALFCLQQTKGATMKRLLLGLAATLTACAAMAADVTVGV